MTEEKATQPEREEQKKEENYHTYEPNPVPWWVVLMWTGFFIFGIIYLLRNML